MPGTLAVFGDHRDLSRGGPFEPFGANVAATGNRAGGPREEAQDGTMERKEDRK